MLALTNMQKAIKKRIHGAYSNDSFWGIFAQMENIVYSEGHVVIGRKTN